MAAGLWAAIVVASEMCRMKNQKPQLSCTQREGVECALRGGEQRRWDELRCRFEVEEAMEASAGADWQATRAWWQRRSKAKRGGRRVESP